MRLSSPRDEDKFQIFVGNLPNKSFNIKHKITKIFRRFGEVVRVQICLPQTFQKEGNSKQKNFGFVSYLTQQGMENALNFKQQLSIGTHYIFCDRLKKNKIRETDFGGSSGQKLNFQANTSTYLSVSEQQPDSMVDSIFPGSGQSNSILEKTKRLSLGDQTPIDGYHSRSGHLHQRTSVYPTSSREDLSLHRDAPSQHNYCPKDFIQTGLMECQLGTKIVVNDQSKYKKFGEDRENLVSYQAKLSPNSRPQRNNQLPPKGESGFGDVKESRQKKIKNKVRDGGQHYMHYKYGPSDLVPGYSPYEENYDYFDPSITGELVQRDQKLNNQNHNIRYQAKPRKLCSIESNRLDSIEQIFQCSGHRSGQRFQGGRNFNDLNRVLTRDSYE